MIRTPPRAPPIIARPPHTPPKRYWALHLFAAAAIPFFIQVSSRSIRVSVPAFMARRVPAVLGGAEHAISNSPPPIHSSRHPRLPRARVGRSTNRIHQPATTRSDNDLHIDTGQGCQRQAGSDPAFGGLGKQAAPGSRPRQRARGKGRAGGGSAPRGPPVVVNSCWWPHRVVTEHDQLSRGSWFLCMHPSYAMAATRGGHISIQGKLVYDVSAPRLTHAGTTLILTYHQRYANHISIQVKCGLCRASPWS